MNKEKKRPGATASLPTPATLLLWCKLEPQSLSSSPTGTGSGLGRRMQQVVLENESLLFEKMLLGPRPLEVVSHAGASFGLRTMLLQ